MYYLCIRVNFSNGKMLKFMECSGPTLIKTKICVGNLDLNQISFPNQESNQFILENNISCKYYPTVSL